MPKEWLRMRSKLVKKLDNYYFKELKGEDLKKQLDDAFVVREDIVHLDQVSQLMSEEQNKTLPESGI